MFRQLRTSLLLLAALSANADGSELAKVDLKIVGLALEVKRERVETGVNIAVPVQTIFGGRMNDAAPIAPGLTARGELTGPGIETPITLTTQPGHPFMIPAQPRRGEFSLQNIRLVGPDGQFLQQAVPSFASISVTEVLATSVKVRQLSADELRARGITVDPTNFEFYEYTLLIGVAGQEIAVPYPVMVDKRTRQVIRIPDREYSLPMPTVTPPPRWRPPAIVPLDLGFGDADPLEPSRPPLERNPPVPPRIPAALIVPTGFGVLHQHFAVILQVSNSSAGGDIRLDSLSATLNAPLALRVANSIPAVTVGQPVPIVAADGTTFLVAGAEGKAEWTLEALKAGTHTVDIEVRATYKAPNQPDVRLRGTARTSLVVSDPRFQITFSHPNNIRKDEPYTTYAFITNLSPQQQVVRLDTSYIPSCGQGFAAQQYVCRTEGDAVREVEIGAGATVTIPYKLKPQISGNVFAAAGTANDDSIESVRVDLQMGVSASGIPLSPATLVMPYYARYLDPAFVDANMQLLGLGYSLATAPLNNQTAKFPRVITTDVFTRAQQITLAGQRIFIQRKNVAVSDPAENADALFHLSLDLLGNSERIDLLNAPDLKEWDQLRRAEHAGRIAAAAMARQLETSGLAGGRSATQFVDDFAAATSHRSPYLLAAVQGGALSLSGVTSGGMLAVPSEAPSGWTRTLPFAELTRFGSAGELAMIGRWKENVRLTIAPASERVSVDLIYPDSADGSQLRTSFEITGARVGTPVTFTLSRGSRTILVSGGTATPLVNPVGQTPLRIAAAAQDLRLNERGHTVSVLFNRPVKVTELANLRNLISLETRVDKIPYAVTRKNEPGQAIVHIPGATLQDDSRIVNVNFDKALSSNAVYTIGIDAVADAIAPGVSVNGTIVPRIDNKRPGGIVFGKLLTADNKPVAGVAVQMKVFDRTLQQDSDVIQLEGESSRELDVQWDTSLSDGRFLFEFVPRDLDRQLLGNYTLLAQSLEKFAEAKGAVRLPAEVHHVNLVFLGRGSAQGQVRYSDGSVAAGMSVTVASTMFAEFRIGDADGEGRYAIDDLPVGPLTFFVRDAEGRYTFAANQIRTPGEVVTQDLVIQKRDYPGTATVRGIVRRSDVTDPAKSGVPNAHVGVYTQGYGLTDGFTDASGRFEFRDVPAGFVSILASEFNLTRQAAAVDLDLKADTILEQTLTLHVPTAVQQAAFASLDGVVTRDDPAAPSDGNKDVAVAGAIVSITGLPSVTADAQGNYRYPDLPLGLGGRWLTVFDPATGRKGQFQIPTLVGGSNRLSMKLTTGQSGGTATARVRVVDAKGAPVTGYDVLEEGIPPVYFTDKGGGIYERTATVGRELKVLAVPKDPNGPNGDQYAEGKVRLDFPGQISTIELRLPGQGTVTANIELARSCPAPPCCPNPAADGSCYDVANGRVAIAYRAWDPAELAVMLKTRNVDSDPVSGLVNITKVPARRSATIETVQHPAGHASATTLLGYDGDTQVVFLRMKSIGDVTGRVVGIDGRTPIAGAAVRLENGRVNYSTQVTAADGTFRFAAVAAALSFRAVAEWTQDGIYRTGYADGATPAGGGPVSDLLVVLREQSSVEGRVTRSGAAAPLALYWARELTWPYRQFGTQRDPLVADINGRFVINNVFAGPFRITAVSPQIQEVRGDYQGEVLFESDVSQRDITIAIGSGGLPGAVSVTVTDPQSNFERVANAEVTLYRNGARFDFTSTDQNGVAVFDQVPVDEDYVISAYSKAVGRSGVSSELDVLSLQTASIAVPLEFRGSVSGSVIDPEGEPAGKAVKGIPVSLFSGALTTRASTGGTGDFQFLGVPEGSFRLEAFEPESGRKAKRNDLFISKLIRSHENIVLRLEDTGTLNVKVHLPNDAGAAGPLAPLVDVTVTQVTGCAKCPPIYTRALQGNDLSFRRMLTGYEYRILARELGGEAREVTGSGRFANGVLQANATLVFGTTGSVQITVVSAPGTPVADAKVTVAGKTFFTPASGVVLVSGLPLGRVNVQASKGGVAASASDDLQSRTIPLAFTLNLGSTVSIGGFVEAEQGGGAPSPGTRVLLSATSTLLPRGALQLEGRTDAAGRYVFTSIPVSGTVVTMTYVGPDDTTIGAKQVKTIADGSSGTVELPPVRLDATPPRILSIDPPTNATNVSPTSSVLVVFSEPLAAQYVTASSFSLLATDTGTPVSVNLSPSLGPNGTYLVRISAPNPTPAQIAAGQKYPLKSNVLYRFVINDGIRDTTGNAIVKAIGTSFTTVNYTEPAVSRVEPQPELPLPEQATFRIKFNKAVDAASFNAGGGGTVKLEQLDAYKGQPVASVPIAVSLDPVDASTVVVAPSGVSISESSFYRLTIAGTRDTQTPPNVQAAPAVFDYFSFDRKKPVIEIVSPVAAGQKLVSGLLYQAGAKITDEGSAQLSKDIAYVDWFEVSGPGEKFLTRARTAPFGYAFAAPVVSSATPYTLKASATDLSGNSSASPATLTLDVVPDEAPSDVAIANAPASLYPNRQLVTTVTFRDEALSVTVAIEVQAKNLDGSDYRALQSKKITRAALTDAWPAATFHVVIPPTVKQGVATIVATATDVNGKSTSKSAPVEVLADTGSPQIVSLLPSAETRYKRNDVFTVELKAKDAESGLARAVFTYDNRPPVVVTAGSLGATYDATTGIYTFRTTVTVPLKNSDTRVRIVATAFDHRDNKAESSVEVVYEGVNDPTVPKASWITPLDGAALPTAQTNWLTTLRVRATDDIGITGVKFVSSALAAPVLVTTPKSPGVYEAKVALTMPADGAPFTINATISDASPDHDVVLPITVDPVSTERQIVSDSFAINAGNVANYANKSLLVRGPNATVYITVPLTLRNLMAIDGAVIGNPDQTKLDVTITDRLFIDADSRIDLTAKGYLGGWSEREDRSTKNETSAGMTAGARTDIGALTGLTSTQLAAGAHAGLGGEDIHARTNATYGSISDPIEYGSGGSGSLTCSTPCVRGGNGGGAIVMRGAAEGLARFAIAGAVRADGETGVGRGGAGAGGSVLLIARALITSADTRVSANGGDDDGAMNAIRGGGGGRVAVRVSERWDRDEAAPALQARGGRNATSSEGRAYADGGAGTVYVQRPAATNGQLVISALDERYPQSTHLARGTPLASASGIDAIAIGPRALARLDTVVTAPVTVDATAMAVGPDQIPTVALTSTMPPADGSLIQATSLTATYEAASIAGVTNVRMIFSAAAADAFDGFGDHPSTATKSTTIVVPATAATATATLKLRVTDRAGRTAETPVRNFTVVANAAPAIDQFAVTPATLQLYAGGTIAVTAAASDDVEVKSLTLASSVGTVTPSTPVAVPATHGLARQFAVAIPPATPSGTEVRLTLSASDDFPGREAVVQSRSIAILNDPAAPTITVTSPQPNAVVNEGAGNTFVVEATIVDGESGVKRAFVTFESREYEMAAISGRPNVYAATIPLPNVDGIDPVAKAFTVSATDYEPNSATSAPVPISIKPLVDPNAPLLQWICSSRGATYPAGTAVPLRVFAKGANVQNGVQKVEFRIDAQAPAAATNISTDTYQATFTIPGGTATGTVYNIVAVATSVGGNEATLAGTITVVAGVEIGTAVTIEANDPALDNQSLIVKSGGILTVVGTHRFRTLTVLDGGVLVQKHQSTTKADVITSDSVFVACGGAIDVTTHGFARNTTYPGAIAAGPEPAAGTGGSHIGRGGFWNLPQSTTFGSVYRPQEGGGGGSEHSGFATAGLAGGVVRLHGVASVAIDGIIRANGTDAGQLGQGAGGSIWITTPGELAGGGAAEAIGGRNTLRGAGGGGAIALDGGSVTGRLTTNLDVRGGTTNTGRTGGAGSVYLKSGASLFGDLVIDNKGLAPHSVTELPSFGIATIESVPSAGTIVLQAPASVAAFFAGHWLRVIAPDGTIRGTWRIASVESPTKIVLENASTISAQAGDTVRGVYRFDRLTIAGAHVQTADLVEVETPAVIDAVSKLTSGNVAPPVVQPSLISIVSGTTGPVVVGQPGAVADAEQPIEVTVQNLSRPVPPSPEWSGGGVTWGTVGGLSLRKIVTGQDWTGLVRSVATSSTYMSVSARASQTDKHLSISLGPADGVNVMGILPTGNWQVWRNGAPLSISGPYTTSTLFRLERTPTAVRWLVDNQVVYTVAADATPYFAVLAVRHDNGEINSIELAADAPTRFFAKAAADGSFSVPSGGAPGDVLRVIARDGHLYPRTSAIQSGAIPSSIGLASLTIAPNPLTGGRVATATATLLGPATTGGATIELRSSSPLATVPSTVTVPAGASSVTFAITSATVTQPNDVTITAWYATVAKSASVSIVKDVTPPAVTVITPAAGSIINEGAPIAVRATVIDEDSGVKQVTAAIGGRTATLTREGTTNDYGGNVTAPFVDGTANVASDLIVTAIDNNDNSGTSAPVTLQIKPVVDASTPSVAWVCGSEGLYPVGYAARLRVVAKAANTGNPIERVDIVITDAAGVSTTHAAPLLANTPDTYELVFTIPDVADGTRYALRTIATAVSGSTASATSSFVAMKDVTELTANTTITASDLTHEGKSLIVRAGTTTIAGKHTFKRLAILSGGTVIPALTVPLEVQADAVFVECGAAVDASGRGFPRHTTYPGAAPAGPGVGGAHLGQGGAFSSFPLGSTFGSVYHPMEHGAGGDNATGGGAGGGVVRIAATGAGIDGAIRANGTTGVAGGGAGGSVWITATKIAGGGSIDANGAAAGNAEGGGGAIAIEYVDAMSTLPVLRAQSAAGSAGGAGTMFVKGPQAVFGDLVVDNGSLNGQLTDLPSLGRGTAAAGTSGASLVTDLAADIPAYFAHHWVEVTSAAGVPKGTWRVKTVNARTLTLEPNNGETIDLVVGDRWSGVYRFDNITLRNRAKVASRERVLSTNAIQIDATSTFAINAGAPVLAPAQIAVRSTIVADVVSGPAGSVTDPDGPVKLTATNTRTGLTFNADAASDGSFAITVSGAFGDTFTLRATDSHVVSLASQAIAVNGTITNVNGVASITLEPAAVSGGTAATGAVRLLGPARAGGALVTLSSSSPHAGVPASVTVPAGGTSTTFAITTTTPAAETTATLTASYASASQTAALRIIPSTAALLSITLSAPTIQGGSSVNGTATLAAPAPPGGAIVALSTSHSGLASVPAVIAIPAGQTQASFTITTLQTATDGSVTITGVYGATRTATLTVTACTSMTSAPAPAIPSSDTVWFEDDVPTGATPTGAGSWSSSTFAAGSKSLQLTSAGGLAQFAFSGASGFPIGANDDLVLYALVNPCKPPRQIVIGWSDGTTEWRGSWGESLIDPTVAHTRIGALPATGAWTRLVIPSAAIGANGKTLRGLSIRVYDGEAWFDRGGKAACATTTASRPASPATEQVWFDDQLPSGAAPGPPSSTTVAWSTDTTQVAFGTTSFRMPVHTGQREHWFSAATETLSTSVGDVVSAWVFLDPCNPPRQVLFELHDGTNWDHRPYWGENLLTVGSTASRVRIGALPELGKWVRLDVPVASIALENREIRGFSLVVYDGQAWLDRVGKVARVNLALGKAATQISDYKDASFPDPLVASRAVDGNMSSNPNDAGMSLTFQHANPWWQVDLGAVQSIESIDVRGRTFNSPQQTENFYLFVSEEPFTSTDLNATKAQAGVSSYFFPSAANTVASFKVHRNARFVRVQMAKTDFLAIAEVQVWAPLNEIRVNLAGGRGASQSSTNGVNTAERAVNVAGGNGRTNSEAAAWWEVDLGAVGPISLISIGNQFATAAERDRLANFYVFISDTPFTSKDLATTLAQSNVYRIYRGTPSALGYQLPVERNGRFIRVQLNKTDILQFHDFEAWSMQPSLRPLTRVVEDER